MLPVALAAAFVMIPPNETALRYSVRAKTHACSAVELLAEKLRVEAVDLREAKKPADALPLFNAAVRLSPDDSITRIGRAKAYAALDRYDEQADEYEWLVARHLYNADTWQAVAEGWLARGKWAEAKACFARALECVGPGGQRSQLLIQEALFWIGREDALYTTAALLSPADLVGCPVERLLAADGALFDALRIDADAPFTPRSQLFAFRGIVRHALGRSADAARDYDEVLALDPASAYVHMLRGQIAFMANDHARAMTHIEAAERHGGEPALVAQIRCKTLVAMGEYERAERVAAEWVRIAPTDPDAAFYRAITLRVRGNDDEADRSSARAAELHKRTLAGQLYTEMFALWAWYSRYEDADRLLGRALGGVLTDPERAGFHLHRGDLRRQMRGAEDGFDDLTSAVRLHPSYAEARKLRAELGLQLKRYADALEDAEILTRLTPWDAAAHKLLAEARGAIQLTASLAGREPDYRPAAPLRAIPRDYRYGVALAAAYLPNR